MTTAAPLAGRAVLVTRPAGQSAGLAERLAALGAEPVLLPTIGIEPVRDRAMFDAAIERLADFRVAIFVSANAVEQAMPAVVAHGGFAPGTPIAAIGAGTARALARFGIHDALFTTDADSEALLELPELSNVAGLDIVIFAGEGGRTLMRAALADRGARVTVAACYRRVVPDVSTTDVEHRLRTGTLDAVTATSSEGLRNLLTMLDPASGPRLLALPHVVPHVRIAEAARSIGVSDITVCGAGDDAIVQALLSRFAAAASHCAA